jgi:phospholipid-binding lipoprotein MlaA
MRWLVSWLGALVIAASGALLVALPAQASDEDPWEDYNRWMYDVNDSLDRAIAKPLGEGYDYITPTVIRPNIRNFFDNLIDFSGVVNALLQGRIDKALDNTFRVVVNSTVGVFGLFDVATKAGVPRYRTDFGMTLARWGVPQGNYVVLPFLGPSSVRHAAGLGVDALISPVNYALDDPLVFWGLYGLNLVEIRAGLLDAEEIVSGDRYVFYRDAYLQNRAVLEAGGQVKDEFSEFEDDWDEEEF